MVKFIHHHALGNITRYTLLAAPSSLPRGYSFAGHLDVDCLLTAIRASRILHPGVCTRSHFISTWRAPAQFVSLATSPPRVGVLACVNCPALRDESGFEKIETFPKNCHARGSSLLHPNGRSERPLILRRVTSSAHMRVVASVERGRRLPGKRSLTRNMKWQVTAFSNSCPNQN